MIPLKIVLFSFAVGYYVVVSYYNNSKLIFKLADILASILLLATFMYGIFHFDIGIILGIILGFGVAIKYINDNK